MIKSIPNRLFVITNNTHFQIIKNYINIYPFGKNYIILTITPFENYGKFIEEINNDKLFHLLGTFINNQNCKFPLNYLNLIVNFFRIKCLKLSNYDFHRVVFSNYNSWLQHLILKETNVKRPVMISDGIAIFKYMKLRKKTSVAPLNCNSYISKYLFKITPHKKIHYFSPIDLKTPNDDTLEVFRFEKKTNFNLDSDTIYFVDSPLVERGFIKLENKIKFLKRLKTNFPEKNFVYFAHRRESVSNLEKYEFFGEIRRDSIPFEERLNTLSHLPFMVISFISSILINLPALYPTIAFHYIKLNENDIIDDDFIILYSELLDNFDLIKCDNLHQLDLN